ncbi:MAG: replicative DNA helicase [Thermotaleaceae bacterium]
MSMTLKDLSILYSIEGEQTVLGCILYEPELIEKCTLKPFMFYDPRHQHLLYVIQDLDEKGKPIDILAIVESVGIKNIDKIGSVSYLTDLTASIPTTENFGFYESIVFEYYQKRQIFNIGKRITQEASELEPGRLVQEAIEQLLAIDNVEDKDDDGHIKNELVKVYEWMEIDHGEINGAATGFIELDRMLGGLRRQDLIVIAARPSMGKTALAVNIIQNYAAGVVNGKGGPAAIFSLEMSNMDLVKRMISSGGNIGSQRMHNPVRTFHDEDWQNSIKAMGTLSNSPIHLFARPGGVDIPYIRKELRKMKRKYPDQHIIVVIDYLQLISGNPKYKENRTAEISEISRSLKAIARELNLTIIALSQLSRGVENRQDKRPKMSDIRESGQIEQDADVIAFLYRDDYYNKDSERKNITEVIISKQRNGPIGTVDLYFIKEYMKFVNLDLKNSN